MPLRFPTPGCLVGHDFSGTIVSLGPLSAATKGFTIGDRVCGAVHASNPVDKTTGAFAEYVSADLDFTLKVPKGMGMDQAAAIGGTGMGTMGLTLKECLGLDGSPEDPVADGQGKEVLVYAASTSIGTLALQLLSLYVVPPTFTATSQIVSDQR
jgi:NADPH:quinone reductase-like Zn-dependent oxidoreductase